MGRSLLKESQRGANIIGPGDRAVGVERGGDDGLRRPPEKGRVPGDYMLHGERTRSQGGDFQREGQLVAHEAGSEELRVELHGGQADLALLKQVAPREA